MRKKINLLLAFLLVTMTFIYIRGENSKTEYSDADFNITRYQSSSDSDNDGIDDQSDILESALTYIATEPVYQSKYYNSGYPDDEYGVCTDVLAFAMLNSGYDLQKLVDKDIRANPDSYPEVPEPDENIDFRRVRNLIIYFENNFQPLTIDESDYRNWQAGDIVIIKKHVGIVADIRNKDGVPYLIHNNGNGKYVQDIMRRYNIVGHYRIDLRK